MILCAPISSEISVKKYETFLQQILLNADNIIHNNNQQQNATIQPEQCFYSEGLNETVFVIKCSEKKKGYEKTRY